MRGLPFVALLAACGVPTTKGEPAPTPAETGERPAPDDSAAADSDAPGEDSAIEAVGTAVVGFDPAPGLFAEAFALTLSTGAAGAEIVYTLDGSDPRAAAELLTYTAPIAVDGTVVLRAALRIDGVVTGPVSTGSWIFPGRVAEQQAPEGWPESWFADYGEGPYTAHYTLEDEVVDPDPDALVAALEALPTLSLVLAPDALWGPTGLYDHAWQEGADWERAVHLDWIEGERVWAADAGMRTYGGASRYPTGTPKKSFRIVFRGEYGASELEAAVFEDEVETLNGFILRAGYNNTWSHWDPNQRARGQYTHDAFARQSQRALGWAASRGRFVHLYLDGVYWGVYDLTERPDASFFAANYGEVDGGADPAGWDALNSGEAIDGDTAAWEATLALARAADGSDESLAALEAQIDADALVDYMLMNFFVGNVDWPYHNWYAGRLREGGRWRFASWDAEHILEGATDDATGVSDAGTPAELWQALLRHPAFVARVRERAAEILGEGGALSAEVSVARYEALAAEARPGLLAESARWGSYRRDVYCYASEPCPLYTMDDWDTEYARITGSLISGRVETVEAQLAARGWWAR